MQRSQFTLEGWRTESTLLGLEHVVRGILGISGLILRPPRWPGGKEKIIIIIIKRTLFGRTLDTLPAANAVHSHLHKSKGRAGCCYSDKSQICRALLREHVRLSGLPRSPNLTLNHVCMFFFPCARPFWEFVILQNFLPRRLFMSVLSCFTVQLTELKFRTLLRGQFLKSACVI